MEESAGHCGFVSVVGKPNVGKSSIVNRIVGQKVSIVTPKPQTTRYRALGIKTTESGQIIFVDTPGFHEPKNMLGELILKTSQEVLKEGDLVYFVAEPGMPGPDDLSILKLLRREDKRAIAVINKVDTVKKELLLPVIEDYGRRYPFAFIIPVSAKTGDGIDELVRKTMEYLPESPKYYPDDVYTDQATRDMASELIREKLMLYTQEEVPHSVAVDVYEWKRGNNGIISIAANIYVEKDSQKGIIIGRNGTMLKKVGTKARKEIELLIGAKVFLSIFVKVRRDWRKDGNVLKDLGFSRKATKW